MGGLGLDIDRKENVLNEFEKKSFFHLKHSADEDFEALTSFHHFICMVAGVYWINQLGAKF